MMRGWVRVFCVLVAVAAASVTLESGASARGLGADVSVGGTVGAPATYSVAQLRALPQTTVALTRPGWGPSSVTGVSLETLVNQSAPVLPSAKNALLRVTVTVDGFGTRTFALGELDPSFGNHPAILALDTEGRPLLGGPELVVPGDTNNARTIWLVRRITVAVESPATILPPGAGALEVERGAHAIVLSAARLASLPQQTLSVSFAGPGGTQSHLERGPTLGAVLASAHTWADPDTWVAGVGADGYTATVTPAEAQVGGRPLLVSLAEDGVALAQPRLVADGDVKGGRYVSGLVDLVVGEGADPLGACVLTPPGCPAPTFPPLGGLTLFW